LDDQRVFEDVLALGLVEFDAWGRGRGVRRGQGGKGCQTPLASRRVESSPEKPLATFLADFLATPPAARSPDIEREGCCPENRSKNN
jgi:hypothetical protein